MTRVRIKFCSVVTREFLNYNRFSLAKDEIEIEPQKLTRINRFVRVD